MTSLPQDMEWSRQVETRVVLAKALSCRKLVSLLPVPTVIQITDLLL